VKKKHAKKLINLYKFGFTIYFFISGENYKGWTIVNGIYEGDLSVMVEFGMYCIPLLDTDVNIDDFKVYNEIKDWAKIKGGENRK